MTEYFKASLRWEEKKIVFKDCSAEEMSVAVNFMFGFSLSGDFKENGELLHLAELFMMEDLKQVTVKCLANELTKDNYLDICQAAELYKVDSLVMKCGYFIYEEMNNCEIGWKLKSCRKSEGVDITPVSSPAPKSSNLPTIAFWEQNLPTKARNCNFRHFRDIICVNGTYQ